MADFGPLGILLRIIIMIVVGAFSLALWGGAVIAIWTLILGKSHRPKVCPNCGADLLH